MRVGGIVLTVALVALIAWQAGYYAFSRKAYWDSVYYNFLSDERKANVSSYHVQKIAEAQREVSRFASRSVVLGALSVAAAALCAAGRRSDK